MSDRCMVYRCHTSVPPARLMCRDHWMLVPYEMQKVILANEPITRARLATVNDAIEHVNKIDTEMRLEARDRRTRD